jgi:Tfp pilus assembly protein PilV
MNVLNWDFVTLLSIAMVVIAIVIVVFLGFKVAALMNRDAAAHKKRLP